MKNWWIGCSGFYYKHWRERFYPSGLPQREWFEYYCRYFNTVELNVTFYRFPKPEALKGWFLRSPRNFRFTVKAPRLITHFKKFNNARRETQDFYSAVAIGLEEKLGTVLFQLPPSMIYTPENLDNILATLDPAFTNVLEFRHESWWDEKVYKVLKKNDITFCSISYPGLPDAVIKSTPVMYYRFHGIPRLYLSPYSKRTIKSTAEAISSFRGTKDAYVYFNNDIDVHAVSNARMLREIVGQ
jgi:uncharacterized protein YecE (DUF72 family)